MDAIRKPQDVRGAHGLFERRTHHIGQRRAIEFAGKRIEFGEPRERDIALMPLVDRGE